MDNQFLLMFGVVSIIAAGALVLGTGITGALIEEYDEVYELGTQVLKNAPQHYPRLPYVRLAQQPRDYDPEELPSKDELTPEAMTVAVNQLVLEEPNLQYAISLKKDRIHTYSGQAGYYASDPTGFVQGYLCSYAYKIMGAPLRCENVLLGYADGIVTFARGYDPDEYVGHQATGTNFAVVFILANPDYGILGSSPVAYLRWESR